MKILLEAARLAESVGKFPDALEYCNRVVQDAELNLYADEALFIMATITDKRLNDVPRRSGYATRFWRISRTASLRFRPRRPAGKMQVQYPIGARSK